MATRSATFAATFPAMTASVTAETVEELGASVSATFPAMTASVTAELARNLGASVSATFPAMTASMRVQSVPDTAPALYSRVTEPKLLGGLTACAGPPGTLIVAGTEGRALVWLDCMRREGVKVAGVTDLGVRPLAVVSNASWVFCGCDDGALRVFPKTQAGVSAVTTLQLGDGARPGALALTQTGDALCVGRARGTVQFLSADSALTPLASVQSGLPQIDALAMRRASSIEGAGETIYECLAFSRTGARGVLLRLVKRSRDVFFVQTQERNASFAATFPAMTASVTADVDLPTLVTKLGATALYVADSGLTLTSDKISAWANLGSGGSGWNVLQATPGVRPVPNAAGGPGGRDSVTWDGTDWLATAGSVAQGEFYTVLALAKNTNVGNRYSTIASSETAADAAGRVYGERTGGTTPYYWSPGDTVFSYDGWATGQQGYLNIDATDLPWNDAGWHTYTVARGDGADAEGRVDGAGITFADTANVTSSAALSEIFCLGNRYTNTAEGWLGDIALFALWTSRLSSGDMVAKENAVNAYYGGGLF